MDDYVISISSGLVTATPRPGIPYPTFSNTNAHYVIQSVINGMSTGNGGSIYICSGVYQLDDELTITGWTTDQPPRESIKITGAGWSTQLSQNTSGKNAIVVKNRVSIIFKDFYVHTGNLAKSGILLSNLGTNECSVDGGTIENIYCDSNSPTSPAFYGINFFGLQVSRLYAINDSYDAMRLENISSTTNYGNSNFNLIVLYAGAAFAGLIMTSTAFPNKFMNLNSFSNISMNTSYINNYGIYMIGASDNSFELIDFENNKYPIFVDGTTNNGSFGNRFNSGYIRPQGTACVGISVAEASGGNNFNLTIDGDFNTIPISDLQQFQAPNEYDIVYSYGLDPTKTTNWGANTKGTFRDSTTGLITYKP